MSTHQSTPLFEDALPESTGILVVNLGTPDAPTTGAVRRFLRQFLWDPHVIQYPRLLWWLILNLVVLIIRPPRSAAAYRKIWTDQGSPLLVNSRALADNLRDKLLADSTGAVHVELAMTYGEPSIASAVDKLLATGVKRLLALPLYPQYSSTSTAATIDAVTDYLNGLDQAPEISFIDNYHDAPGYIEALADSVRNSWESVGRGNSLLMSFHGVPESTLRNGDPYHHHCQNTAQLLANSLCLEDDAWAVSFQSRVGREKWLAPYTDEKVRALGERGLSQLDVVCPGFSTDCLETLEEIAMQNAEFFSAAGGGSLNYIPSLNSSASHVRFLAELINQRVASWKSGANNSPGGANVERAAASGTAQ